MSLIIVCLSIQLPGLSPIIFCLSYNYLDCLSLFFAYQTIIWIVSHYFLFIIQLSRLSPIIFCFSIQLSGLFPIVFCLSYNYLDCLPLFFAYHTIIWIISHYFLLIIQLSGLSPIIFCLSYIYLDCLSLFFLCYLTVFCGYRCQCFYLKTFIFSLKTPTIMLFWTVTNHIDGIMISVIECSRSCVQTKDNKTSMCCFCWGSIN